MFGKSNKLSLISKRQKHDAKNLSSATLVLKEEMHSAQDSLRDLKNGLDIQELNMSNFEIEELFG